MESKWFQRLVQFLGQNPRLNWTYWALNGSDHYGLLNANYDDIKDSFRQSALASVQSPLGIGLTASALAQHSTPLETPPRPSSSPLHRRPPRHPPPASNPPHTRDKLRNPLPGHLHNFQGLECRLLLRHHHPQHWYRSHRWLEAHLRLRRSPEDRSTLERRYTQDGPSITITNESWNTSIPPAGEQSGIGFNASYTGSNYPPTRFYLNGTLCK